MPGFSMYGFFGSSHRDVMIADPDSIWGHEFYGGAGNDLFVVLNRGWLHENGRYQRTFDRGSAKLQYTFRL